MENAEREKNAMQRLPEKTTARKVDHAFPDFELDTGERPVNDDRLPDGREHDPRNEYRVWRCNGVPIGVRFHKQ